MADRKTKPKNKITKVGKKRKEKTQEKQQYYN